MGIRVIKTALAATIAVFIAMQAGLATPLSAGLLAILGVDVTKRRGLRSASVRIAASVLGLFLAALMFRVVGYPFWALGLYVLIVYPILSRVKLQDGIITSTVVMLHLFSSRTINTQTIANEVMLLFVGLGTASLINIVYMPPSERRLLTLKKVTEEKFRDIFVQMARHLKDHRSVWDGKEFLEAEKGVREGAELARQTRENTLFARDDRGTVYFAMRREQLDSIERMLGLLAQVYETLPHGQGLAEAFEELSELVAAETYTGRTEERLAQLDLRFKEMPLPATRQEFEIRSALLQLMHELRTYIGIAKRMKRPVRFESSKTQAE